MVGGEEGGSLTGGIDRQLRARVVSMFIRQRLTSLLCEERFNELETVAKLIVAGKLSPSISKTVPLDQVAQAMRDLDGGAVHGKVAIVV